MTNTKTLHEIIALIEAGHTGTAVARMREMTEASPSPRSAAVAYELAARKAEDHGEPGCYQGASSDFRSGYEDAGAHIAAAIRAAQPAPSKGGE